MKLKSFTVFENNKVQTLKILLFSPQVIHAARTLVAHPVSKIAQENMEVFVDVWEAQVEELGKVLRLITAGGDPSKSKCTAEKIDQFQNRFI